MQIHILYDLEYLKPMSTFCADIQYTDKCKPTLLP